jgi:hypothetical protein
VAKVEPRLLPISRWSASITFLHDDDDFVIGRER